MKTTQRLVKLKGNQQLPLFMLGATELKNSKNAKSKARSGQQGGND